MSELSGELSMCAAHTPERGHYRLGSLKKNYFSFTNRMVAYPILWYYRSYRKKIQTSRVLFEGAPSATFFLPEYRKDFQYL